MEVEKRCTELVIQLEKAREEGETIILKNEVEMLLLRREDVLKDGWKEDSEEKINARMESSLLLAEVDERGSPVSVGNPHLDQSLASELGCTWIGGVQLDQSLNSSQDVASQTDLFAYELEGLKQAMADDSPQQRKHFFAIEEDECSLDIPLEVEEGEEEVVGDYGKHDEAVGETEGSLEEELRSSVLQEGGEELEITEGRDGSQQQELMKTFLREGKLGSPFCGKILGKEMLVYEVEGNSLFEREASMSKPSSVDCAVNTETSKEENEVPKKTFFSFVKSLLAWLLLLLALFTTFGAVRVDHKVHLPSTWILLYRLFGSSLPFPFISLAFDSNPRPFIN